MSKQIQCDLCKRRDAYDLIQHTCAIIVCCECIKIINGTFARRNNLEQFVYIKN